jgi:hypothetical protein
LELFEHLIEKGASRTSGRSCGDEARREPEHGTAVSADDDLRGTFLVVLNDKEESSPNEERALC